MDSLRKASLYMYKGLGHLQGAQVPLDHLDNLQEVFKQLLSSYDLLGSVMRSVEKRHTTEKTASLLD